MQLDDVNTEIILIFSLLFCIKDFHNKIPEVWKQNDQGKD